MSKVFQWVKEHPFETGIGVFGVGALIVIYASSGSTATGTTTDTTKDPNADALAASEYQTQAGLQADSISAGVANNQIAASVTNTTTAGNVQENADTLSAQTSQVIAGLEASVQNTATSATETESLAQTSALQNIALAPYQVEEDQLNTTNSNLINSLDAQVNALVSSNQNAIMNINSGNIQEAVGLLQGGLAANGAISPPK